MTAERNEANLLCQTEIKNCVAAEDILAKVIKAFKKFRVKERVFSRVVWRGVTSTRFLYRVFVVCRVVPLCVDVRMTSVGSARGIPADLAVIVFVGIHINEPDGLCLAFITFDLVCRDVGNSRVNKIC